MSSWAYAFLIKTNTMENKRDLKLSDIKHDIENVFCIEMDCFVCGGKELFQADTEIELLDLINKGRWKYLNSDHYESVGWYCNCDYPLND